MLGEINGGWAVAMTLLGYERGEAAAVVPIRFREEFDRLVALAQATGADADPVIRNRLAACYAQVEIMRLPRHAHPDARSSPATSPGPRPRSPSCTGRSTTRSSPSSRSTSSAPSAMTPEGRWPSNSIQTDDPGAPDDSASWVGTFYAARGGTIYAGTSQVQRNIIGERILGSAQGAGMTLRWWRHRRGGAAPPTVAVGDRDARSSVRLALPGLVASTAVPPDCPTPAYLRFRMITAYGDPHHEPEPRGPRHLPDWCRAWPRHAVTVLTVERLRLVRVRLPLRIPHVAADGTEAVRDVVLASWTRPDGVTGWGECPTLSTFGYSDEITDTAWVFLREVVGPIVADTGALPRVEGSPMAMAAVRDAMLDARLRAADSIVVGVGRWDVAPARHHDGDRPRRRGPATCRGSR